MTTPIPIGTNRNQALVDLGDAHSYFVACFKRDEKGEQTFCGYVSAESSVVRRELWGAIQQWLVYDQTTHAMDAGWFDDRGA